MKNVENIQKVENESGISNLVSFNYRKSWIVFNLANGISGIIANTVDVPFTVLITMKSAPISWVHKGQRTDKNGKVFEAYELGFSMV